jgi:hypothetical protein
VLQAALYADGKALGVVEARVRSRLLQAALYADDEALGVEGHVSEAGCSGRRYTPTVKPSV